MLTSQPSFWNGPPEELREIFVLRNARGTPARCTLSSNQLGWAVKLTVNGSLIRSQVVRDVSTALEAANEWRTAMEAEEWR